MWVVLWQQWAWRLGRREVLPVVVVWVVFWQRWVWRLGGLLNGRCRGVGLGAEEFRGVDGRCFVVGFVVGDAGGWVGKWLGASLCA